MDSILLSYIHYHFKLEYPFVCGCESFFSLAMISIFMKYTNGFYLNQGNMKSELYRSVIDAYIWALLKHHCLLEVFMENTRSRTGKINQPSEELFGRIVKLYLTSPERKDVRMVPVTINYDRVHDGESFPLELLGEQPQRNNIYKIMQHFIAINKPLGRVMIKYCEPLSLERYIKEHAAR
jgi:glycerol-3-phosphate O-acyltransferase